MTQKRMLMGIQRLMLGHFKSSKVKAPEARPASAITTATSDWKNSRLKATRNSYVVTTILLTRTMDMEQME